MRSQTTKPLPKKGTLNKTALKAGAATKQTKKKLVSPKKVKNLVNKSLVKSSKRNSKDESQEKSDKESSSENKSDVSTETSKGSTSKGCTSRSESPTKNQKKDPVKNLTESKKVIGKKVIKTKKKINVEKSKETDNDHDDIKYKINSKVGKKVVVKNCKTKMVTKKGNQKKNVAIQKKQEQLDDKEKKQEQTSTIDNINDQNIDKKPTHNDTEISSSDGPKSDKVSEFKSISETRMSNNGTATAIKIFGKLETPKMEIDRPHKFFTSSRSPRTIDIDVKFCKNSKGNISVSERFLSMKCEPKVNDNNMDKNTSNTLVTQGPDIDVYTFTEKVDSPKSILSDFRSPIHKNIGRVRPIARVKGTIIDKRSDTEKKKYSPHRPIEEVVKQLKANKRSEELGDKNQTANPNIIDHEKGIEDIPKPIVSKSYKMVARKSSVTGKPFSPIKFLDQEPFTSKSEKSTTNTSPKKISGKAKKQKNPSLSDEDFDSCKFSLNTVNFHYTSSEESISESNDDNDTKESSGSDSQKPKKAKNKKYKKSADHSKKTTSKELKELSKDSLIDLKDDSVLIGEDKPSKRRRKLLSMWTGPKKHRMASLNAIAKVHCLYENESRTHMELGLMKTVDRQFIPGPSKQTVSKKKEVKTKEVEKHDTSTSESEYENKRDKKGESSESSDDNPPQRKLRGVPGIRSAGKYWDPKSSTSSSEDSELESKKKVIPEKKKAPTKQIKPDNEKPPAKMKKTGGVPVKKKRNRNEVVMDLKDMVVQKRMASLNATAILAASYEKRSPKSNKDETTSDSCSDESFSHKSKNGVNSGVKSEVKCEDARKDDEDAVSPDRKQKVEVIVNQDTDVTITGVYATHHHEGFCTVSGMQYRISSTSHTQTTATANSEKDGCSRDDRYTPLSALSSMQPPAEHVHSHAHPVAELGSLTRRGAGCSSAFSAPSPSAHHDPGKPNQIIQCLRPCLEAFAMRDRTPQFIRGYYQPAGPLIKETGADAERAIARYHPPPHYHPPHPPVLQQYGPYYPPDLCYGRYYRPPGPPYHMPPQPDAQMVGVGSESYSPQYYSTPPCYQHSPQRIPYVEYRGCPCPLNACPKNVHIGPATGKAPTGGGPGEVSSILAPPGGAFRAKVRACAIDASPDLLSGKDPPEPEPPAAANAPHPCPLPAIGGASPKREIFDGRDSLRLAGDLPGPTEAIGPPSPARGSAGVCAPQPPPVAPRRARLGKAMARRSLAGDDTGVLLSVPQPLPHHSDADDDVMAISPPSCAPIDLSSSDERSTPLVDVKKENEGPTCASTRKTDAQALKEHNCTSSLTEPQENSEATKPAKRRYSRPKLEIDMKDTQLEEGCKTNCIGEHVKLQKRRKVSGDQTTLVRVETTSTKEPKKKSTPKKTPKSPNAEKRAQKRKLANHINSPKSKKMLIESTVAQDPRLANVAAQPEDRTPPKPKIKSALLLDNLIRKNSIDRLDGSGKEINPAELFLSPIETSSQNSTKKTLNINNNIVENSNTPSGVRPNTIAAVSQLLANKHACKVEKVDSKVSQSLKSVLKPPNEKLKSNGDSKLLTSKTKIDKMENGHIVSSLGDAAKLKITKTPKSKVNLIKTEKQMKLTDESHILSKNEPDNEIKYRLNDCVELKQDKPKPSALAIKKSNGQLKNKSIENVAKLLSKKPLNATNLSIKPQEIANICENKISEEVADKLNVSAGNNSIDNLASLLGSKKLPTCNENIQKEIEITRPVDIIIESADQDKIVSKRCKLSKGEMKAKKKESVVKLLVSKKPAIKTDEATLVIEDACASPVPGIRKPRRRRSGGMRRMRRPIAPLAEPALESRAPPRWSNGWKWDSENYVSKVYLNNDSRLDRTARCYTRMSHESGDAVGRGDCVLLRASTARAQPFVARVASLWENPEDGEMMVSLVWYYRPEHTERGREPADAPDEVFASRHRDANSVACIEDKCYVLTFNEYCRYRKRLKAAEEGVIIRPSIVPPLPPSEITPAVAPNDSKLPPSVSPELVLFCRKIYDFRSKKIQVPNK